MGKKMNGLQWYKKVYKFLSSQKSYLIITQSDEHKLSLIDIINSHKGQGIRLKAEYKKYGLYLSRGRRGDAAVVTQKVLDEFCNKNSITNVDSCKFILHYTAKMFQECHHHCGAHIAHLLVMKQYHVAVEASPSESIMSMVCPTRKLWRKPDCIFIPSAVLRSSLSGD